MRLAEAFAGELDFDQLDSRGLGTLHWCVSRGEKDLFTEAIEKGAPVDQSTAHTEPSPLHDAVGQDTLFFTRGLVRAGALLDATDRDRRTPLHIAAGSGKLEQVMFLIEAGSATCPLTATSVGRGANPLTKKSNGQTRRHPDATKKKRPRQPEPPRSHSKNAKRILSS